VKKGRFSVEQITSVLQQVAGGIAVARSAASARNFGDPFRVRWDVPEQLQQRPRCGWLRPNERGRADPFHPSDVGSRPPSQLLPTVDQMPSI
jgi:hypothetical protein